VQVVTRLVERGYEAYLVGGCVRDLLLGLKPKDFDVATSARPEQVRKVFRNSRIIGRRFKLAHVFFRDNIIETATFRSHTGGGKKHGQGNENIYGTARDDAFRRDFSVNALYFDPKVGKIHDPCNGISDLRAGIIRSIGTAKQRMEEDPVRMIRAVRFAAKLNMSISKTDIDAIETSASDLKACSVARLAEETLKLLRCGASKQCFDLLGKLSLLPVLLPEFSLLRKTVPSDYISTDAFRSSERRGPSFFDQLRDTYEMNRLWKGSDSGRSPLAEFNYVVSNRLEFADYCLSEENDIDDIALHSEGISDIRDNPRRKDAFLLANLLAVFTESRLRDPHFVVDPGLSSLASPDKRSKAKSVAVALNAQAAEHDEAIRLLLDGLGCRVGFSRQIRHDSFKLLQLQRVLRQQKRIRPGNKDYKNVATLLSDITHAI